MLRGLEGRRIAVFVPPDGTDSERLIAAVSKELEGAGAIVQRLTRDQADEDWHGAKYAALVVAGTSPGENLKLVQLVQELLVSEKPVATYGGGLSPLFEAGGVEGRTVAAAGPNRAIAEGAGAKIADAPIHVDGSLVTAREDADPGEFARTLVRELSKQLEEREVDEMSAQSFPASDPPATSPASVGHVAPDRP